MSFFVSKLFAYLQDLCYLKKKKSMRNGFTGEKLKGQNNHFNLFPLKKTPAICREKF